MIDRRCQLSGRITDAVAGMRRKSLNAAIAEALGRYVEILSESADRTHRAEDRQMYQLHLAAAARMFVACMRDETQQRLRVLIAEERRSYGWTYLSDAEGERAERAFDEFARRVENSV